MDPISQDEEHDLGFQQFIDDEFDKLIHTFIEFENTILPAASSTNPTNVQHIIEPVLKNEKHTPLLQRFDNFENTMLLPCQFDSKNVPTFSNVTINVASKVPWRRRRKRKYRGVYESEEEAAHRMALLKIKNRVSATRSYEKKQAYEAQLKARIQNLRKVNEFLKKLLKFFEGNPIINLTRKPLKRTLSCPA